jgi:hypothetical protein
MIFAFRENEKNRFRFNPSSELNLLSRVKIAFLFKKKTCYYRKHDKNMIEVTTAVKIGLSILQKKTDVGLFKSSKI